jgi:hypothetical protein
VRAENLRRRKRRKENVKTQEVRGRNERKKKKM